MNIIQTIERANYAATDTQVETLAHAVALGRRCESTYLRVLVAHCQAEIGGGRRKIAADAQEAIIDKVHTRLYAHVQKGVVANGMGSDEMPQAEINRRSTFARSSTSELRGYVQRGGDLRALKVGELTRQFLRKYGRKIPTGTRAERALANGAETVRKALERIAKNDPDSARAKLDALIADLQAILESDESELPNAIIRATPDRATRARAQLHSRGA